MVAVISRKLLYTIVYLCILGDQMSSTTIRVNTSTKKKLEALKAYKRESYDDLFKKLLVMIPEGDDEGKYTDEFRAGLLESLFESKTGQTIPFEQLKKELGLE